MQILYFTENKIIFESRAVHSTDHAFLQLIDQIYNCFDEKKFYLGIFVDLSKAFDTVHHKILIKKLEKYGIFGKLLWFKSYYSNRKQYAEYKNDFDGRAETCIFTAIKMQGATSLHSWTIPFFNIHK